MAIRDWGRERSSGSVPETESHFIWPDAKATVSQHRCRSPAGANELPSESTREATSRLCQQWIEYHSRVYGLGGLRRSGSGIN